MAIEFARVEYVKRSNGGNTCRSAAYDARADMRCERTGERFYFAHRDGLLHHEVLLPEGTNERLRDIQALWNAAQAAEKRKDAQEAKELLLALPSNPEMGLDDWRALTTEFAQEYFVSKGVAVQLDIHAPHEGETNVHAHLLITTRRIEGDRFSATKARDLDPEVRTGRNGRPIVAEGEAWGALWRDFQNGYFERWGLDLRVDETGIVPQKHEGPVRMRTVPESAEARARNTAEANEEAARDPEQILATLTRRRATFTTLDVERQLRKHIKSAAERQALRDAVLAHEAVIPLHERADGEFAGRYTTRTVREEEQQVLTAAATVAARREGISERHRAVASGRLLDEEQNQAFLKATGTDGLVLIEGLAGAGKSYSVGAIREAHEAAGWRVIGLAPTNTVADDLRRGGFAHGSTVHLELFYQENARHDRAPAWDRRTCVVVDEAAMLDTRIYARLMQHAADTKAKVVLVGDDRQLASIERGGMFTALKERHGSTVISRVRRQEEDWQRTASEDFAGGRVAEGLRAYAERGNVHWSDDLEESRTRLLSDWDQDSRQRPEANRFVYASTNAEANKVNQAIRDIRRRRVEVEDEITVETVRGETALGTGDRIQFFANDRKAGIYNGTLATVSTIEGTKLTAETDTGRSVRFDAAEFQGFGLGYAGTVYRGQGKTQTEVYALYDSPFAWNARTAYVGMTRHKASVNLYVSQELAPSEPELAKQMSRRMRDEASLAYATPAEVVHLSRQAPPQPGPPAGSPQPAEPSREAGLPRDAAASLKQADLTAYARDVHGFTVHAVSRRRGQFELHRGRPNGSEERLEARRADDGRWMWRNPADPRERGDILDLAKREGAADLAAARAAVARYVQASQGGAMQQQPESKRRKIEEELLPDINPADPEAALKRAAAEEDRRKRLAGAGEEDRRTSIRTEEEQRQTAAQEETAKRESFFKEEADRKARLHAEAQQAQDREQAQLREMQAQQERHQAFVAAQNQRAEEARRQTQGSGRENPTPSRPGTAGDPDGFPASASLRYSEALARHYDPSNPYGSLAQAALAEGAVYQRDRYELDRKIALEGDASRREMLQLRRNIEHGDHLGQAWERIAGQNRAIGSDTHKVEAVKSDARAQGHRDEARQARGLWEQRSIEQPSLYPPLNDAMRQRVEAAREVAKSAPDRARQGQTPQQKADAAREGKVAPDQAEKPEPVQRPQAEASRPSESAPEKPTERPPTEPAQEARRPRSIAEETAAMRRMNMPAYAAEKHGYDVEWRDQEQTRATLRKSGEELRVAKSPEGEWRYTSKGNLAERDADIVEFEAHRGAKTRANAREAIRPELERQEQERARTPDQGQAQERQPPRPELTQPQPNPSAGQQQPSPEDPRRRRGRGR